MTRPAQFPRVIAVSSSPSHQTIDKDNRPSITLLAGIGVEADAHAGATVQNPWKVRRDPSAPNLSQVHLLAAELLDALDQAGYPVVPGQLGENITTRGIVLEALPQGTLLRIGADAVVRLTGLRDPCRRINSLHPRLLKQVLHRDPDGTLIRRAGVMAVVEATGRIAPGMTLHAEPPPPPHTPLPPV
ncbi:MOSC domain-containing protein [Streptomyces sp. NPDC005533]|uniref:MOSC domain-containing protein n=1 Tax=Streptomyces sp. NPDC005533 TaxID=3364723 RepID=UPI00367E0396